MQAFFRFLLVITQLMMLVSVAFVTKTYAGDAKINNGEAQYLLHCAGCHRKDLKGSIGFNLKDGEWIHGGSPAQILHSINKGFSKAGMPGFEAILDEQDRQAIVSYILSKREGFENLQYLLYQLDDENDTTLLTENIVKSGRVKNNFMDFDLPEIPNYGLVFEGDFYAPKEDTTFLYAEGIKNFKIDVLLDGKLVTPHRYGGVQRWKLKQGKQHVKFTFVSAGSGEWNRNINLYVTNADSTIKLFPVSTRALANSKRSQFDIKSTDSYIVQQKKIIKLPAYSVAVGAPSKVNYAFNTKSCAVNGMWEGDMLDIGPNIGGRGKDGSIPLGDWLFHYPAQIVPVINNGTTCNFIKYRKTSTAPMFFFSVNDVKLSLTTDFTAPNKATFIYRVIENPASVDAMTFLLPDTDAINASVEQSKSTILITNNTLSVDISQQDSFSIQLNWTSEE
jgi:cytochrome c553